MSFDWTKILDDMIPVLGDAAVTSLKGELTELSGDTTGWKKDVLALLANAVEVHGTEGVQIGMDAINKLLAGESPKIDWADLRVASDIVASMQEAEAAHRDKVNAYTIKLSHTLGKVFGALLKGLIG